MTFFDTWKEKWDLVDHRVKIAIVCLLIGLMSFIVWGFAHSQIEEDRATAEITTEAIVAESTQEVSTTVILYVDVKGAVNHPGVYQVSPNSRIQDAIQLAGGLTNEADQKQINFAQKLEDQMVVNVPKIGEEKVQETTTTNVKGTSGNQGAKDSKVNINTATVEQLMTLKGVGQKKAEAIIEYRKKNGSFKSKEELMKVRGIGKKMFETFQERVVTQ